MLKSLLKHIDRHLESDIEKRAFTLYAKNLAEAGRTQMLFELYEANLDTVPDDLLLVCAASCMENEEYCAAARAYFKMQDTPSRELLIECGKAMATKVLVYRKDMIYRVSSLHEDVIRLFKMAEAYDELRNYGEQILNQADAKESFDCVTIATEACLAADTHANLETLQTCASLYIKTSNATSFYREEIIRTAHLLIATIEARQTAAAT